MNNNHKLLLTEDDKKFLQEHLSKNSSEPLSLTGLFDDEASLDVLLENPKVTDALLQDPGCVNVSSGLYFYVTLSRGLKKHGIEDRRITLHICRVLERFQTTENISTILPECVSRNLFPYVVDLLQQIAHSPKHLAHARRLSLADLMLFMTGIFHELIEQRKKLHAAPPLEFYERVGSGQYRLAAEDGLSSDEEEVTVYSRLGDAFHELRVALNDISERIFHFHSSVIALGA